MFASIIAANLPGAIQANIFIGAKDRTFTGQAASNSPVRVHLDKKSIIPKKKRYRISITEKNQLARQIVEKHIY